MFSATFKKGFWILIATTVLLDSRSSAMYRQWNDRAGTFSIEADFIAYKNGKVYLEKKDGSALSFPVDQLSRADRDYLRSLSSTDEVDLHRYLDRNPLKDEHAVFLTSKLLDGCASLAFSPDGRFLALGTHGGLQIVDLKTSQIVTSMPDLKPNKVVYFCRFSPDGKKFITGHVRNTIKVWNVSEPMTLTLHKEHTKHRFLYITAADFSPDGKRVLTGDLAGLCYWDLESVTDVRWIPNSHSVKVGACLFNRDGTKALVAGPKILVQYDLERRKVIQDMELETGRFPTLPALSHDGNLVAIADFDGLHLWKTFEPKKLATLKVNLVARAIAFSPDGKYLLAGCAEDVMLWRLSDRKLIHVIANEGKEASGVVAFSPDSRFFAASSGSRGRTVQVFRIPQPSE